MKLMSFWSKFLIAFAITILATSGVVVGVLSGQKEQIDMGGSIKYSVPYFTVDFLNYDDTVFETQQVAYGQDAIPPSTNPVRPGYTFKSWTDYTNITQNRRVTANWIKNEAYLTTGPKWQAIVNASAVGPNTNIEQIEFVTSVPSGATLIGSVGVTDETATTVWTEDCSVFDVKAYYTALSSGKYKISFYSPYTIYAPKDSGYLFSDENDSWGNLESIKLTTLDTSKVTNMDSMFYFCTSLKSLDVSMFDTSNVEEMSHMFSDLYGLTSLDLSNFDTSNVASMISMFALCESLVNLDVSNFNTSRVKDMSNMFVGCQTLTSLDVSNFDTLNVVAMTCMFEGCSSLTSLDISNFDISNVEVVDWMFSSCSSLTSVNIEKCATSNNIKNMSGMFYYCSSLTSLDLSNFDTSNVTNMSQMFSNCSALTSLNLSSFDMSNVSGTTSMLSGCSALAEIQTPKAIGSTAVDLPSSNWRNEANPRAGAYSKIQSSMLTSGSITLRPGYLIYLQGEYPREGYETYRPFCYVDGVFKDQEDEWYSDALQAEYPGLNSTVSNNSNYIQLLPKDPNLWTTVGTNRIQTTMYIWGNSQYSIRVPEGYFMEIVQYAYDGTAVGENWTLGNEYVGDGQQNDVQTSINTHTKAYKLQLTLWNTGKTVKPSSITTSALSNLHITMESDDVINVWYGHEIPMPRVYVLGMTYSDRMEGTGFTTSSKDNTLFISYATPGSVGSAIHWEIITPTIYNLYVNPGNGTYDGQSGKIKVGQGYAGQDVYVSLSKFLEPDGYSVTKFTQASGSKGLFVQGTLESSSLALQELLNAQEQEMTYRMGPGDATIQLKYAKNTTSYLRKDWKTALENKNANYTGENFKTIEFTNTKPTGTNFITVSVGSSDADGQYSFYSLNGELVNDVTAYIKANASDSTKYDVIFYSPVTIYAPIDSSNLFSLILVSSANFSNFNTNNVTNMESMFYSFGGYGGDKISVLDLSNFNTSKVTNMSYMFFELNVLTAVLTSFDTSNVTNMAFMFTDSSFEQLNLSSFNTSKVTNMSFMFKTDGCSLTQLDLSSFDTSNVTDMSFMFSESDSSSLKTITFSSKFNTSKVTDMDMMFSNQHSLTSLDLSSFNTSNVTDMSQMFNGCSSLTSLDLSSFDMSNVTNTSSMLLGCSALTEIQTPKAIGSTAVDLPTATGKYWFEESSLTSYTQINSSNTNKTLVLSSGYSFLRKDWQTINTIRLLLNNSTSSLRSIVFTNTIPTDLTYKTISVGATNQSGTTAYTSRNGIFDVTLYYFQATTRITKCVFYSPVTIYMPTDASYLLNFPGLTELDFSCASFEFTTTANNTITACTKLTKITRPLSVGSAAIQLPVVKGHQWQTTYALDMGHLTTQVYENLPAKTTVRRGTLTTINLVAKTYKVTLDKNGGSGGSSTVHPKYGSAMPNTTVPTREGYMFVGYGTTSSSFAISHMDAYDSFRRVNFVLSDIAVGDKIGIVISTTVEPSSIDFNDNDIDTWDYYQSGSNYIITINHTVTSNDLSTRNGIDYSGWRFFDINGVTSSTTEFTVLTAIKGHFYYLADGTSAKNYDIASDTTLYAQWVKESASYLRKDWFTTLINEFPEVNLSDGEYQSSDGIASINFTNTAPTDSGYTIISVGATDKTGQTAYTTSTPNVLDVKIYIKKNSTYSSIYGMSLYDVIFYSPVVIYAPEDSSFLFAGFDTTEPTCGPTASAGYTVNGHACITANFDNLNTSYVINMSQMFNGFGMDVVLTTLDLSSFDFSNVTNLEGMFHGCCAQNLVLPQINSKNYTSTAYMFANCFKLTSLDVSVLDISNVTNLEGMFGGCSALTSLDVSNFNTSKVTDMAWMFSYCSSLTSLDVSVLDTSKVTDMAWMFSYCSSLTSLDVSNFNTSNVTNMSYMFQSCSALTSLNLSNFDTSNVTDMSAMFYSCSSLTSLDVSVLDTSKVTNMSYMFHSCSALTSLNLSNFDTSNVTDMSAMFYSCSSLTSLNVSNFNTSKVTIMSYMFEGCSSLTSLDVSNFNTSKVTNMSYMFQSCSALTSLNLSSFDMSNVTRTTDMLSGCSALTEIQTPKAIGSKAVYLPTITDFLWVDKTNNSIIYTQITSACTNKTLIKIESHSYLRKDWQTALKNANSNYTGPNIKTINFVKTIPTGSGYTQVSVGATAADGATAYASGTVGVSDVIAYVKVNSSNSAKYDIIFYSPVTIYAPQDSSNLFSNPSNLTSLTSISFGNFNTINVTNMFQMFGACEALTSLDVSNFNTSNVTDMSSMFSVCKALTSLNLSNFDTSNVTSMAGMFGVCSSLTSLNVSNFNTSNVTSMAMMFYSCSSLTSLNLSNFNTSNVTNMLGMFHSSQSLTSLNISSFDMSNVTDTNYMLSGCSALITLYSPKTMKSGQSIDLPGTTDSLHAWYKSSDTNRNTPYTTLSTSNTGSTLSLRVIMRTVTITWSKNGDRGKWNFHVASNGSVLTSGAWDGTTGATQSFRVEATASISGSFYVQSPSGLIWHKKGSVSLSGTVNSQSGFGESTADTAGENTSRAFSCSGLKSNITITLSFWDSN